MSLTSPQSPFQSFHFTLALSEYRTRIGSWKICDVTNRACRPRLSKLQQQVTLLRMIVICCVSRVITYWHFGSVAPVQHQPKSSVLNDLWMRLINQHLVCYKIWVSARIVLQSEAQTSSYWRLDVDFKRCLTQLFSLRRWRRLLTLLGWMNSRLFSHQVDHSGSASALSCREPF